MTMTKRNFTLIELLVVVGIIAVLAGLLTPAVIGAQQQGRITQAKSDMAAILMALKGLDNTYGKILAKNGTNYELGNQSWSVSGDTATLDGPANTAKYYAFIAEISDPGNKKENFSNNLSVNKRKIKFLDPKPEYNPAEDYDDPSNTPHLWLDPWGNPYVILVNIDYTEKISDPTGSSGSKVAAKAIAYSYGPDGEAGTDAKNKDNVCSWKDSWK